eukprot:XP_011666410.1 PREDICTED: latent-transforming growth factor beta-binding protein 4-like [Strongylocentrotus purpuratus]
MASEFSLGEFVRDPSAERLSSLTKVELLDVAAHYEVVGIKRYLLKSDILNRIVEFLVAEEVLSSEAADINECDNIPNPCGNGTCNNIDGTYGCTCDSGFEANDSGTACDDVNECAGVPNPCGNGECTNTHGSYMCVCDSGFTISEDGSTCDVECGGAVCQNAGACVSSQCKCVNGFTGSMCENDIDDCILDPCENGGSCTDEVNAYTCACVPGYTGMMCETGNC